MQGKSILSKTRYVSFVTLMTSLLLSGVAIGAEPLDGAAKTFSPTGPWSVGSTELSNVRGLGGAVKMPCVLSNEFDNGFIMRFSGGGQQMLALAMDFRQDVFVAGREYSAMLSLGDAYVQQVKATAFTKGTLIFNLRPMDGFYNVLQQQGFIQIDVEGNNFKFSLQGINDQFSALEGCYAGKKTDPIQPLVAVKKGDESEIASALPKDIEVQELPKSFDDIVEVSDAALPQQNVKTESKNSSSLTEKKQTIEPKIKNPSPAPTMPETFVRSSPVETKTEVATKPPEVVKTKEPAVSVDPNRWTALAGENVRDVLNRWADKAGYDLNWQAQNDAKIAQTLNIEGSFEDAVTQMMAESSVANGIEATVANHDAVSSLASTDQTWVAQKGSNLEDVLRQWANKQGVILDWQSSTKFMVKTDFKTKGSFESAVESLLDQYIDDKTRPVGELAKIPPNGEKVLIITRE